MPAAQLKMLRYMRSSEPKGPGNNNINISSSTANGSGVTMASAPGGSPKQPSPPATTPHPQHTVHAPLPLSARQQLAEAAKIPVPTSHRGTTPSHQTNGAPNGVLPMLPQQHPQHHEQPQRQTSFQRARSNSDNNRPFPASMDQAQQQQQQQQQIWEESSINSMFTESVVTAARPPQRPVNPNRYDSPFPQHRTQHLYERNVGDKGAEEPTAPLLVSERGVIRILPTNGNGDVIGHGEDLYAEKSPYGSPSRHMPVLKHSKYALRDARGATRRSSFSDRQPYGNFDDAAGDSPERRVHQRNGSIPKLSGSGGIESAFFRDVDAPLGRAVGRPETDDGSDLPSQGDEATNQRTPRQKASPPGPPPQQPPPAVPQKRLQESSLPRAAGGLGTGGGSRREKKSSRKRRHSPDYDDSMLHAMSYSELHDEPFDHDPARIAVQAPAAPAKLSLEDRLVHFKGKDGKSQHHFFTEMPVQEWDECGDWFLEQFAELSNKIRAKRQAKRRKVAEFEAEIAEREKTVRLKAESIERTLGDLKHEGEGMMRSKFVGF